MYAILIRQKIKKGDIQTLGRLKVIFDQDQNSWARPFHWKGFHRYECETLELPWMDNRRNISCIPADVYEVVKHISPRHGECFEIQNVPNRTHILIHAGNYYTDIEGCILVGSWYADIDKDGNLDVARSKKTLKELLEILPDEFSLVVHYES